MQYQVKLGSDRISSKVPLLGYLQNCPQKEFYWPPMTQIWLIWPQIIPGVPHTARISFLAHWRLQETFLTAAVLDCRITHNRNRFSKYNRLTSLLPLLASPDPGRASTRVEWESDSTCNSLLDLQGKALVDCWLLCWQSPGSLPFWRISCQINSRSNSLRR